ncbi:MAG: hypothetical protein QE164_06810 [Candidatus Nezhaarchaeota archaeon]|nr:hypothetical protein [Candidatus Nezhaarchaeota archaeon]
MPRPTLPKKIPIVPEDLQVQVDIEAEELDEESLEDTIQAIVSNQGFNAIISVIDSLISTIERQEIMIWSLTKLLEEKGFITREEFLKKISELNRKRLEDLLP